MSWYTARVLKPLGSEVDRPDLAECHDRFLLFGFDRYTLSLARKQAETLLTPDPVNGLLVDAVPLVNKARVDPAKAEPGMLL